MDNTVGYVLLGSASVPGLMGLFLSLRGLTETAVATQQVKAVAKDAAVHVQAAAQSVKALAADPANALHVAAVADAGATTAMNLGALNDSVSGVSDALSALTGKLAPARVCFALAALLVVASLVAFGLVSASTGSSSGGTSTTTSTTTTATTT